MAKTSSAKLDVQFNFRTPSKMIARVESKLKIDAAERTADCMISQQVSAVNSI
jgi:hypothetical protein